MRGWLVIGPLAALLLSPAAAAAPRSYTVVIDKMRYGALPTGAKVGDMIVWDNRDIFRHSATARDGSFNVDLVAGAKGKIVLRKAGAIAFTCKYHPGMHGVLQVGK